MSGPDDHTLMFLSISFVFFLYFVYRGAAARMFSLSVSVTKFGKLCAGPFLRQKQRQALVLLLSFQNI